MPSIESFRKNHYNETTFYYGGIRVDLNFAELIKAIIIGIVEGITEWLPISSIVSCVPAGVIGLAFNKYMEQHFMTALVVASTLIIYGVLFIVVENTNAKRTPRIKTLAQLDYKTAFIIGCFQVLALVPGTSRSGSTILGGILFGTSRFVATEFTFFLAIPIMFGASLLKLVKFGWHYTGGELLILSVGMATAFIVSVIAIKLLLRYIKKNDFKAFGWYRIALGLVVLAYLFLIGDPVGTE